MGAERFPNDSCKNLSTIFVSKSALTCVVNMINELYIFRMYIYRQSDTVSFHE